MAQAVETTIEIDGIKIKQFASLKLSQGIYAHHTFRLVCPVETVEEDAGTLFNGSRNFIGAPVRIQVTAAPEQSELLFNGIVTAMEAVCNNGHPGNIIMSGYSTTIMLDNAPHCRSWMRQSIKSIVKEVLDGIPSDWLKTKIKPMYKDTLYYTVQYKENAWQFMRRLAATHGEWLYYNGRQLVLGEPVGNTVKLTYGLNLSRFALQLQLKPGEFQVKAYDYVNNEVYEALLESGGHAGQHELAIHALNKSSTLFGRDAVNWHNQSVKSKKQVADHMSLKASMQHSDTVRMKGSSDLPGFQPGDTVQINMDKEGNLGEFRIIGIEHSWDGIGNYANEFEAIPASVKVPPVEPMPEPRCETQGAVVIDNYDESGLGRLQVRFHWMNDKEKTPWLRVVSPYAGNGNGLFIRPEKGEEVLVAFAGGHATQPFIIGAVNNGKAKTEYGNENNDVKAIQTRSGIKLLMNDKEGSTTMEDKNGNRLVMDGDKMITLEAKGNLKLVCGDAQIELKNGVITLKGVKVDVTGTDGIKVNTNAKATISAGTNLDLQASLIRLN